jgi:hypothetical protein
MFPCPGLSVGSFATRKGAQLASADVFAIHVEGKGTHAAEPHKGVDTLVVGANVRCKAELAPCSKGYFYRNIAVVYVPFLYLDDLGLLAARQQPTVDRVLLFGLAFHDHRGVMSPTGQTLPDVFLDV